MEEKDIKQTVIRIEETETVSYREPDLPTPLEGKAWKRKSDGVIFYGGVYLGKRFYSATGKELKTPVQEKAEDFELIDIEE